MIKTFSKFLKELKLDDERIINRCQEIAICTSYYIDCQRRKEWTDLELVSYTRLENFYEIVLYFILYLSINKYHEISKTILLLLLLLSV